MAKSASAEYCKSVPCLCQKQRQAFIFMVRICIYIDGANFLYGIRYINKKYTDFKFDFEKFVNEVKGRNELVCVYYYNASLKQELNKELFIKQQQFFERLRKIKSFKVVLCKRQRRSSSDGKEFYAIKGDDIHLAVDMLKDAFEDRFDEAVLVSGDGDFSPLVRYVKDKGKIVENYHFKALVSLDLIKECNLNKEIDKKMVNRLFLRGEKELTLEDTDTGKDAKGFLDKLKDKIRLK
jgi:uncharacterized LabA/DUF88 family protein